MSGFGTGPPPGRGVWRCVALLPAATIPRRLCPAKTSKASASHSARISTDRSRVQRRGRDRARAGGVAQRACPHRRPRTLLDPGHRRRLDRREPGAPRGPRLAGTSGAPASQPRAWAKLPRRVHRGRPDGRPLRLPDRFGRPVRPVGIRGRLGEEDTGPRHIREAHQQGRRHGAAGDQRDSARVAEDLPANPAERHQRALPPLPRSCWSPRGSRRCRSISGTGSGDIRPCACGGLYPRRCGCIAICFG